MKSTTYVTLPNLGETIDVTIIATGPWNVTRAEVCVRRGRAGADSGIQSSEGVTIITCPST
jgi:hypothetical protein